MLFKKFDLNMPDFWSYLEGNNWRDFGAIRPQGLGVLDLNGDKADELIFLFWQDVGYLNHGINYTGNTPTRLLVLESGPSGYTDQTSKYFPKLETSIDGFAIRPTLIDANEDGYTDIWWVPNREDGRQTVDWEAVYTYPSLFIFDPNSGSFKYHQADLKGWGSASYGFESDGKTFLWASGVGFSSKMYFDSNNPNKMISAGQLFNFDKKNNEIIKI